MLDEKEKGGGKVPVCHDLGPKACKIWFCFCNARAPKLSRWLEQELSRIQAPSLKVATLEHPLN